MTRVAKVKGEVLTFHSIKGYELATVAKALNINADILDELISRVERLEKKEGEAE